MTTNQTIDGVPRELLRRVCDPYRPRGQDKARAELRALLDAPAYPSRLCHIDYTAHPYICGCLKGDEEAQRRFDDKFGKPAAQPQGDTIPVSAHWSDWSMVTLEIDGRHRTYVECGKPERPQGELFGYWLSPCNLPAHGVFHRATEETAIVDGLSSVGGFDVIALYAEQPAPVAVLPEKLIAAIEAEQERLSQEDYLMDSEDCVKVIREEVTRLNTK